MNNCISRVVCDNCTVTFLVSLKFKYIQQVTNKHTEMFWLNFEHTDRFLLGALKTDMRDVQHQKTSTERINFYSSKCQESNTLIDRNVDKYLHSLHLIIREDNLKIITKKQTKWPRNTFPPTVFLKSSKFTWCRLFARLTACLKSASRNFRYY